MNRLIGVVNVTEIELNGIKCIALFDTGSMISSVSEAFFEILQVSLQSLNNIVRVEGAGLNIDPLSLPRGPLQSLAICPRPLHL